MINVHYYYYYSQQQHHHQLRGMAKGRGQTWNEVDRNRDSTQQATINKVSMIYQCSVREIPDRLHFPHVPRLTNWWHWRVLVNHAIRHHMVSSSRYCESRCLQHPICRGSFSTRRGFGGCKYRKWYKFSKADTVSLDWKPKWSFAVQKSFDDVLVWVIVHARAKAGGGGGYWGGWGGIRLEEQSDSGLGDRLEGLNWVTDWKDRDGWQTGRTGMGDRLEGLGRVTDRKDWDVWQIGRTGMGDRLEGLGRVIDWKDWQGRQTGRTKVGDRPEGLNWVTDWKDWDGWQTGRTGMGDRLEGLIGATDWKD